MNDLIKMLKDAHERPFSTEHDHRMLLIMAARALENQKATIHNLLKELAAARNK